MVIDYGRNASIWVVLGEALRLLFTLPEVEEYGLVRQAELFENDGDFPVLM